MVACWSDVGPRGILRGEQCCRTLCSAVSELSVCVERWPLLEKALSYKARSAALPTFPKRCVVVKEHLPASLRACSGVICCVCRCSCIWLATLYSV